MEHANWNPKKPYDLRERLFEFGRLIIRLVQYLHTQGPIGMQLSEQILKAGTSAAANYEEADDASGRRDELAKKRIALRELKETRTRLGLQVYWALSVGLLNLRLYWALGVGNAWALGVGRWDLTRG